MESDNLDIESITEARRKKIAGSLRDISLDELNALWAGLFTDLNHPWRQRFRQFIDENAGSKFYYATDDDDPPNGHGASRILKEYASSTQFLAARDHYQMVYCRDKEKGIWFIQNSGVGLLEPRELELMKEIVDGLLKS